MDFSGTLAGGLSGGMHFGGDGDSIDVTPILTSGTKIATITVNEGTEEEVSYDLYAPDTLSWDDITDKPTLFSGVYGDLSSKPTLDGNVINGNMFTHNYSTNEQRIGTWIDGNDLYQCTFEVTLAQNVTHISTSSLNIKKVIECFGACDTPSGDNCLFIPYYEDSTSRMVPAFDYSAQELNIVTTYQVLNYYNKLSITIKYTKNS